MSNLVLTAAFGPATRFHSGPKHVMVFGQLLVGGSGLYLFKHLDSEAPSVRVRADSVGIADALMAGFVVAEPQIDLEGPAASLAATLRADALKGEIELDAKDAAVLADAIAGLDVALLLTLNEGTSPVAPEDFRGWSVTIAAQT